MSYCRWSSMNFKCDLYIYETVGGLVGNDGDFIIHVAGNRVIDETPDERAAWSKFVSAAADNTSPEYVASRDAYFSAHKSLMDFLETAEREDIELPYAGATIVMKDREALITKLLELRALGYVFPDVVFERLEEEMAEENSK